MYSFDCSASPREACSCYVLLDDLLIVDSLPRSPTVQGRGVGLARESVRRRLIAPSLFEQGSVLLNVLAGMKCRGENKETYLEYKVEDQSNSQADAYNDGSKHVVQILSTPLAD